MTMSPMMRPKPTAAWKMVHVSEDSAWVQQAQPKETRNAVPMNSAAAILMVCSLSIFGVWNKQVNWFTKRIV